MLQTQLEEEEEEPVQAQSEEEEEKEEVDPQVASRHQRPQHSIPALQFESEMQQHHPDGGHKADRRQFPYVLRQGTIVTAQYLHARSGWTGPSVRYVVLVGGHAVDVEATIPKGQ